MTLKLKLCLNGFTANCLICSFLHNLNAVSCDIFNSAVLQFEYADRQLTHPGPEQHPWSGHTPGKAHGLNTRAETCHNKSLGSNQTVAKKKKKILSLLFPVRLKLLRTPNPLETSSHTLLHSLVIHSTVDPIIPGMAILSSSQIRLQIAIIHRSNQPPFSSIGAISSTSGLRLCNSFS